MGRIIEIDDCQRASWSNGFLKTGTFRALDVASGLNDFAITDLDYIDASNMARIAVAQRQSPKDQSSFADYVDPLFLKLNIFITCNCGPKSYASVSSFVACTIGRFQNTILGSDIRKIARIMDLKSFPEPIDC